MKTYAGDDVTVVVQAGSQTDQKPKGNEDADSTRIMRCRNPSPKQTKSRKAMKT